MIPENKIEQFQEAAMSAGGEPFEFEGIRYIPEGRLDRIRARVAQIGGAGKALKKAVSGSTKIVTGAITGKSDHIKAGADQLAGARHEITISKINRIKELKLIQLDKMFMDIQRDLDSLNIKFSDGDKPSTIIADSYKQFRGHLRDTLNEVIAEIQG